MSDENIDDSSIDERRSHFIREDDYLSDIDETTLNDKKKLEELKKNKKIKSLLKKRKRKIKSKNIDKRKTRKIAHNNDSSDLAESNNYAHSEKEEFNDKVKEKSLEKKRDIF